jgi:FkbM family methyltransferase
MKFIILKLNQIFNFYRQLRDILDFNQPLIITKWGFKFSGNSEMANGNFEKTETELLLKLFNNIDILVNVGANIGYYSCLALNLNKKVIAFEPIQRNLKYLLNNIKVNGWNKNIEIYQAALGKENDILTIYGGNTGASLIKGWAEIPETYSTNRFNGEKILVLIDIEGSEYNMLQGCISLLDMTPSPIWLIEITLTEHQPNGINPNFLNTFEIFSSRGYNMYYANNDLEKLSMQDILSINNRELKPKSHNYLFTKGI